MVVSNGTLNQSISLGKPTNIAKCDEIVGLKDKFIEQLGDSHDRSLRSKKKKAVKYITVRHLHIRINTSASEVPLTRLPVMPCTTKPVR